jgi:serine/threonine-protein kinase
MAAVYLSRMIASTGFSRLVAIKRMHREYTIEKDFVAMLNEEARLAAHIRHANVIDTLDLAMVDGSLSLVLEYVEGESLSALSKRAAELGERIPVAIAATILHGVLRGLEAAHEARRDDGQPLGIIHRDVSPQNVLVGIDGSPRIIDFGIAKALDRLELTRPGEVRGKLAYMPPEQLLGRPISRQVDVYAAGVVLWELLAGKRLFSGDMKQTQARVLAGAKEPPSTYNADVPRELDVIVMKAIEQDVSDRYLTARDFAAELEPWRTANEDEIGEWVSRLAREKLAQIRQVISSARPSGGIKAAEETVDKTVVLPFKPPSVPPATGPQSGPYSAPHSLPPISTSGGTPFATTPLTTTDIVVRPRRPKRWLVPLLIGATLPLLVVVLRHRAPASAPPPDFDPTPVQAAQPGAVDPNVVDPAPEPAAAASAVTTSTAMAAIAQTNAVTNAVTTAVTTAAPSEEPRQPAHATQPGKRPVLPRPTPTAASRSSQPAAPATPARPPAPASSYDPYKDRQ